MYESALPDETLRDLEGLQPAALVVGIPSYRNPLTIGPLVERVTTALATHYAPLHPLLVHADGHSQDDTLASALQRALPAGVRRLATPYQGLSGKGSALRAIFEVATRLHAQALLLVEADITSLAPGWVPTLLEPLLAGKLDLVLPHHSFVQPAPGAADLLAQPLLLALFGIPLRYPTGGTVGLSGKLAAHFGRRDVWETDVARGGVDVWMTVEAALSGARLGERQVGGKVHQSKHTVRLAEATFLQEIGTLFRLAAQRERAWRWRAPNQEEAGTVPGPVEEVEPAPPAPDLTRLWQEATRTVSERIIEEWASVLLPDDFRSAERWLAASEPPPFDSIRWARMAYDFVVAYNLGEGDPDRVVLALYPLFLLHNAALVAACQGEGGTAQARERLLQQQRSHFMEYLPYLHHRWARYVPPQRLESW